MDKRHANRIPEAEVREFQRWELPEIDHQGAVLPSAEREAAEREKQAEQHQGESVEDIDYEGEPQGGLSASELENIVANAEREGFEQGREAGFEKGMAEGYESGREQGLAEKRQELAAEQRRFEHLMQALLDPMAKQDEDIEKMLLDIVCTLSRSLVERELRTDSSHILKLVKAAVAALPRGANNLRLYLNPADLALVEAYAREQQLSWKFFPDQRMVPGGCRVETRESHVDFSVENRLEQQLAAFVSGQLGEGEAPSGGAPEPDAASPLETPTQESD